MTGRLGLGWQCGAGGVQLYGSLDIFTDWVQLKLSFYVYLCVISTCRQRQASVFDSPGSEKIKEWNESSHK